MKKAARIAASICDLSKPMLSISAICAALSAPIARPEVAPEGVDGMTGAAVPAPAGEGVAGMALVVVLVDWAGAAGGAGVEALAGAGVEGGFEVEAAAAGAALG